MNSFVKGFVRLERGSAPELSKCTPEEKCKYFAHQLLMLRWEQTLFAGDSTVYIDEYKTELRKDLTAFFKDLHAHKNTNLLTDTCERWMNYCLDGVYHRDLKSSQIFHLLSLETEENDIPEIAEPSFYKPYVHFLLNESLQNMEDFTQANGMSLPTMKLKNGCIAIAHSDFSGYRYESAYQAKLAKQNYPEIFRFSLGIDLSGLPVESVLAPFSQTYITLDTHASDGLLGCGSLHTLYCDLRHILFGNHQSSVGCKPIPNYVTYCDFTRFLREAHMRYGVEFGEKRLPEQILGMNPNSVEKERLRAYLNTPRSQMTVEAYNYFKQSDFGVFAKLDILCQSTEEENSGQEGTTSADNSSENKGDSDKQPSEGDQSDVGELARMVNDMENSDDEDGDTDTTQPDQGGNTDAGSSNTATPSTDAGGDTTEKSPSLPNSNDSQGIEIKLSKGTNLDNYLFRQEVSKLIDTVLEQPERTYKEQDIALVKELKTYYLYIFDVETICEILAMATSIPIKFKMKEINK